MNYNFKSIKPISNSKDLINIVLSKTQRKTPTVVHPGYNISRIRGFYMRKIKFCEDCINEKLTFILQEFPKVEEIHPFYGDLINVLYDKDHYKLALGHIKASKNMIENLAKDYLKLVKYADSLYRCKSLKKAALGRMCTIIKKISASLSYLQEVRKHIARLPTINPFERTLLVTGYPNVGKSSFVNSVTKANVEVQPYPFTTQALYVGHTDYKNIRFQVIDSPGILDHPLQQMNTIQMQSVTALAHLKSCILYFLDLSQQCGYSLKQQINLYSNIKPLFKNKPVLIVLNKIDLRTIQQLSTQNRNLLENWLEENKFKYLTMSALNKEGTDSVKQFACEEILAQRSQQSVDSLSGGSKIIKLQQNFLRGIYVAQPKKRDQRERPPVILPEKVELERPTLKELEQKNGGAGVFNFPIQQHYILPQDWKYDQVPQIFNGKNIADFVDKQIWEKLGEIQREEEALQNLEGLKLEQEEQEIDQGLERAHKQIQIKKHQFRTIHKLKQNKTAHEKNKKLEDLKQVLDKKGIETNHLQQRLRSESKARSIRNQRSKSRSRMVGEEEEISDKLTAKIRDKSRSRSIGYHRNISQLQKASFIEKQKRSKKWRNQGKAGETDRVIPSKMPKHLYSGKSSNGSKDWR